MWARITLLNETLVFDDNPADPVVSGGRYRIQWPDRFEEEVPIFVNPITLDHADPLREASFFITHHGASVMVVWDLLRQGEVKVWRKATPAVPPAAA